MWCQILQAPEDLRPRPPHTPSSQNRVATHRHRILFAAISALLWHCASAGRLYEQQSSGGAVKGGPRCPLVSAGCVAGPRRSLPWWWPPRCGCGLRRRRRAVLSSPLPHAALLRGAQFCVTVGEVVTWLPAFAVPAWGEDNLCMTSALADTGGPVPSSQLPHAALLSGGRCRVTAAVVVVWLSAFAASAWGHAMAGWRVPLQVWVRGGCGRHLCRMRHCCVASCFASPPRWWSSGCRRFEAVLEEGGGATRCGREVCVGVVSSCLCRCAC